jgi:transposase
VLQYHFNWKMLSAMAGVTWWNFYFRLFPGAIRSPQIIEFLSHFAASHSRQAADRLGWTAGSSQPRHLGVIREQRGRLWVEFLPGYAPELNPVEYLWSHWKQHELPNLCPQNFGQLSQSARQALRRMRKRPTLLIALWRQAELFPFVTILCNTQIDAVPLRQEQQDLHAECRNRTRTNVFRSLPCFTKGTTRQLRRRFVCRIERARVCNEVPLP